MAKNKDWYWSNGFLFGPNVKHIKPSSWSKMPGCHQKEFPGRVTWHSEGVDRPCQPGHVANLAKYVRDKNIFYHAIVCDRCDEVAQIIPKGAAARSMKGGSVHNGCGNSANRHGKTNFQVCFAGRGNKPLKNPKNWKPGTKKFLKKVHKKLGLGTKKINFQKVYRSRDKWCDGSKSYAAHSHGPTDSHSDIVALKLDWKMFKKHVLEIDD